MIMGTVMKVLHNVIDLGMGIQEACASVAEDASGDKTMATADLGSSTLQALSEMGHTLDVREPSFLPHLFASPTGILVDQATGKLHGGALEDFGEMHDPQHQGQNHTQRMPVPMCGAVVVEKEQGQRDCATEYREYNCRGHRLASV